MNIITRKKHPKGILYEINVEIKNVKILFLFHAIERMKKWKITEEMIIETLISPEEVLIGHNNRFIAHKVYGEHIVRAVYEYENGMPVLITVYFPYKNKYFRGGNIYEDKILSRG